MLYKLTPMGYFGRVNQTSRGPWFRKWYVEDDGLEWYYTYGDNSGTKYLLSNNIPIKDRNNFARLFQAHERMTYAVSFASYWLAFETVLRDSIIRKWALGWRGLTFLGLAQVYAYGLNKVVGADYAPLLGAYLRKYSEYGANELWEIQDRKREFY